MNSLLKKKILLIICGGISAYKSLELIRSLKKQGSEVKTILTKNAKQFVTSLSVVSLSGEKVYDDLFNPENEAEMDHIALSRWADLILVAPATANTISKLSSGFSDDLASTVILASDKDIFLAPAMNVRMWEHPSTKENLNKLKSFGYNIIGPEIGDMACGEFGEGKMTEPNDIVQKIDLYFYEINKNNKLKALVTAGPTNEYIDPVRFITNKSSGKVKVFKWREITKIESKEIHFSKYDFDQELAILYSSGTTGKPKCICHRSGGVLLQHKKEHQLHCDIKEGDNIFYFTTCGWMMWNWLVSALASKASIVLFDGSPMYKKEDSLLRIAEKEKITLFGVSAKYIDALRKFKPKLKYKYKLSKLRTICSTGSPLSNDGFRYVYENIKKNVHLSSISGGTDIISCFVLGNLYQPVILGEIQNKGLGLDVDIFNEKGKSLKNRKGELVCKNPFPSMPLKFWNDKNDIKFHSTYFNNFLNIWHHGDYAQIRESGGFIIHGRSDTTLNPGGVRLGTAEIYSEVEKFIEVKESIVIGQAWDNDIRIVLFIVLNPKYKPNDSLLKRIKIQIRKNASPRHVPSKILVVNDIPRTKNGKIVELAVKNIVEGNDIKNKEALANPNILEQYKNLKELKY